MKNWALITLIILILLLPLASAVNYPQLRGFVTDNANIIDAEYEEKITQLAQKIEKETTVEIAVVTIESLEGESKEMYAVKLFEQAGIGKKDKDNGLLILVAKNEREYRFEVGYGLEGVVTDSMKVNIGDRIIESNFRNGEYGRGLYEAVLEIKGLIEKDPSVLAKYEEPPTPSLDWLIRRPIAILALQQEPPAPSLVWLISLIIPIVSAILFYVLYKKAVKKAFSWDKIPGTDNVRLREFLQKNLGIDWVKKAKIEKIEGYKTIRLSSEKNCLSLRLNDEKTRVNLIIDDLRTIEFIAKKEKGELKFYSKKALNYTWGIMLGGTAIALIVAYLTNIWLLVFVSIVATITDFGALFKLLYETNKKKAWRIMLGGDVIAMIITYLTTYLFLAFFVGFFGICIALTLISSGGGKGWSRGGGFGGGFEGGRSGGFGGGRSGGGGFGGKW